MLLFVICLLNTCVQSLGMTTDYIWFDSRDVFRHFLSNCSVFKNEEVLSTVIVWIDSLLTFQQYMSSKTPEHELLFDLLQKMMNYDASKRITLEQAIAHPFFNPLRKDRRKWLEDDIYWTLQLPGRLPLTVSVCFKTACFITSVPIYYVGKYGPSSSVLLVK